MVDGKRHYGDGLYKKAVRILRLEAQTLRHYKRLSDTIELCLRKHNLTWQHHMEVASLKTIEENLLGKLSPRIPEPSDPGAPGAPGAPGSRSPESWQPRRWFKRYRIVYRE